MLMINPIVNKMMKHIPNISASMAKQLEKVI